jgi:hypothetical protein
MLKFFGPNDREDQIDNERCGHCADEKVFHIKADRWWSDFVASPHEQEHEREKAK